MSEKVGLEQQAINAGILVEIWRNIDAYVIRRAIYDRNLPYSDFLHAKTYEVQAKTRYANALNALRESSRSHYEENANEVRRAISLSAPALLCEAIQQRSRVEFVINDSPRIVAPYVLYFAPTNQSLLLVGIQAEPRVIGRRFNVWHMTRVRVLDESFTPTVSFEPNEMKHRYIVCCIDQI